MPAAARIGCPTNCGMWVAINGPKETPMPRKERIREAVTSLANPDYLTERAAAGWRLTALEWEREVAEQVEERGAWSEERGP